MTVATAATLGAPTAAVAAVAPRDPCTHTLLTPQTAGGLSRDQAGEQEWSADINQFRQAVQKERNATSVVAAFYKDPSQTSVAGHTPGVLFLGATTDSNGLNPDSEIEGYKQGARATSAINVNPGPGGGKGVCVQSADQSVSCAWVTTDSFGALAPTYQTTMQAAYQTMLKMRPDLEKPGNPGQNGQSTQPSQPSQPGPSGY